MDKNIEKRIHTRTEELHALGRLGRMTYWDRYHECKKLFERAPTKEETDEMLFFGVAILKQMGT